MRESGAERHKREREREWGEKKREREREYEEREGIIGEEGARSSLHLTLQTWSVLLGTGITQDKISGAAYRPQIFFNHAAVNLKIAREAISNKLWMGESNQALQMFLV